MPARSGAEYLAGLRDGREIWFGGERVASVPDDPILGRMARTLAELYDLQWDPAYQPRLTYPSPTSGDLVSLAFLEPRSREDLVRRREISTESNVLYAHLGGQPALDAYAGLFT